MLSIVCLMLTVNLSRDNDHITLSVNYTGCTF